MAHYSVQYGSRFPQDQQANPNEQSARHTPGQNLQHHSHLGDPSGTQQLQHNQRLGPQPSGHNHPLTTPYTQYHQHQPIPPTPGGPPGAPSPYGDPSMGYTPQYHPQGARPGRGPYSPVGFGGYDAHNPADFLTKWVKKDKLNLSIAYLTNFKAVPRGHPTKQPGLRPTNTTKGGGKHDHPKETDQSIADYERAIMAALRGG